MQVDKSHRIEERSEDVKKLRYSHQDWNVASLSNISKLGQKCKEPTELLFFEGAIYECTYNCEGKFSHSQAVLLFELPSQEDLNNW